MSFISNPTETIGIDVSDHVIRAIVMKGHSRKKRISHFAQIPLDPNIIVDGEIRDVPSFQDKMERLFSRGIHPKRSTAVVGLPESHGFIKTLQANPEEETKELQKHLPFPYKEVTIDSIRKGPFVSFAAIKTAVAQSYLDALTPLGIHIRALEIEPQAIARLFASELVLNEWPHHGIILGDIGHTHTTFLVIHNGLIEFTHTSKLISGKTLTGYVQEHFNVSEKEAEGIKLTQQNHPSMQPIIRAHTAALANELKRVVDYHRDHPVGDQPIHEYIVYLMGSGSRLSNLRQYLEESVRFPVQQAKISTPLSVPRKLQPLILSYGTAIGLALREFNPL